MATNCAASVIEELNTWIKNFDNLVNHKIEPVLAVGYNRFTLVSNFMAERVTIDTNLFFEHSGKTAAFDGLAIVEVKQSSLKGSIAAEAVKAMGIRQGGLSKYCTGLSALDSKLKQNNFKPKLRALQQMLIFPDCKPTFYA